MARFLSPAVQDKSKDLNWRFKGIRNENHIQFALHSMKDPYTNSMEVFISGWNEKEAVFNFLRFPYKVKALFL